MREQASTTSVLRRTNAEFVLHLLREAGPQSVSALQQKTGLSRPTVDAVAADLVSWNLVEATIAPPSRKGGRPARRLAFRPDAGYVVGIDIGRHSVSATVADLSGAELASHVKPATAQMSARRRLTALRQSVTGVLERAGLTAADIIAAGVGTPGPVDADTGVIGTCTVLADWAGVHLGERVADLLDCDVAVEKDANLSAIAEVWRGAAMTCRDVASLMVGERPGAGLIMNGELVHGNLGWAGELYFWGEWNDSYSHVPTRITDRTAAEVTRIVQRTESSGPPHYRPTSAVNIDLAAALPAMRAGNRAAAEAVRRFAGGSAWTLVTISSLLGPERIVISGMPTWVAQHFVDAWQRVLNAVVPDNPTELRVSPLGDRAVLTGALRSALDRAERQLIPPIRRA